MNLTINWGAVIRDYDRPTVQHPNLVPNVRDEATLESVDQPLTDQRFVTINVRHRDHQMLIAGAVSCAHEADKQLLYRALSQPQLIGRTIKEIGDFLARGSALALS